MVETAVEHQRVWNGPTDKKMDAPDYYEFLQISPNAELATIQRVYRFLASRFHPDNAETGNVDKFVLLNIAFEVLSDPKRRAEYDAIRQVEEPAPMSASIDFMDGIEGELNRRVALLALLYLRRRTHPDTPEVPLTEIEARMGFPRDYLTFTTWYLKSKQYVTKADNAEFTLTALGVDFVETNHGNLPILSQLLNSGNGAGTAAKAPGNHSHAPGDHSLDIPGKHLLRSSRTLPS
jgi:curved DNA-binding protein CbpA